MLHPYVVPQPSWYVHPQLQTILLVPLWGGLFLVLGLFANNAHLPGVYDRLSLLVSPA